MRADAREFLEEVGPCVELPDRVIRQLEALDKCYLGLPLDELFWAVRSLLLARLHMATEYAMDLVGEGNGRPF